MPLPEEEIIQGNKLIMFFDGAEDAIINILGKEEKAIKYNDEFYPEWNLPEFHKDWRLLMPVVEKIGEMHNQADYEFSAAIEDANLQMFNTSIFCNRDELFRRVVEFIQWYNTQTPK